MVSDEIDISESELLRRYPQVLTALLLDHTTQRPIFWATDHYAHLGAGYQWHDAITPERITGEHGHLIQPRVLKSREQQLDRTKQMAEVFTPAWVCNAQNNLIDEAWFGRPDVFNVSDERDHSWQSTTERIVFPEGKTWQDYVRSTRMEITCGEGPYLVSRYNTVTGEFIPLSQRVGILDRKLRVVAENTIAPHSEKSAEEITRECKLWRTWALEAYRRTLGYEWQGDSLLLTREALLRTFVEHHQYYFPQLPLHPQTLLSFAYVIAWNVWQMDGLKGVVPDSCHATTHNELDLFASAPAATTAPCPGCASGNIHLHNGTYCLLRDWGKRDPITHENHRKIRFVDLLRPTSS